MCRLSSNRQLILQYWLKILPVHALMFPCVYIYIIIGCVYICMYVCMYVCIYVCMYVSMCVYVCIYDLSPLGSTNNVFNVAVDVGVAEVTCHFPNGPLTSVTCTIQYGTDPTYVNLPYTDSSNGTNINNVTIPLSGPLQSGTLYYYVTFSMGDDCWGIFRQVCTTI